MEYEILVQLKGEVLDPEARAIQEALSLQGVLGVSKVTVSKRFVVTIDKNAANPESTINKIAAEYLANPVSQTYSMKRLTP
jgi:phosphoribosylformylglycinamidine synthase PurS subunit